MPQLPKPVHGGLSVVTSVTVHLTLTCIAQHHGRESHWEHTWEQTAKATSKAQCLLNVHLLKKQSMQPSQVGHHRFAFGSDFSKCVHERDFFIVSFSCD